MHPSEFLRHIDLYSHKASRSAFYGTLPLGNRHQSSMNDVEANQVRELLFTADQRLKQSCMAQGSTTKTNKALAF